MKKKDIPNIITISRMVLSPIIVPIIWSGQVGLGIILFIVTALTDLVDGKLARHWKAESVEGKYLDMFADKEFAFLVLAATISISPFMIAFLGMEIAIARVSSKAFSRNHKTGSAYIGKIKTAALSVLMGIVLFTPNANEIVKALSDIMNLPVLKTVDLSAFLTMITPASMIATLGLQTATLKHYVNHYYQEEKRLEEHPEKEMIPTEEEITTCMSQSSIAMHFIHSDSIRKLYRCRLYRDSKEDFTEKEKILTELEMSHNEKKLVRKKTKRKE